MGTPPVDQHALSRTELDIMGQVLLGTPVTVIGKSYPHVQLATIEKLVCSPRFQNAKREIERRALENRNLQVAEQVRETFENGAPGAATELVNLSHHSEKEGIRLAASTEVLDRAGFQVVKREERRVAVVNISDETLAAVIRAAETSNEPDETEDKIMQYVEGELVGSEDEPHTEGEATEPVQEQPLGAS